MKRKKALCVQTQVSEFTPKSPLKYRFEPERRLDSEILSELSTSFYTSVETSAGIKL